MVPGRLGINTTNPNKGFHLAATASDQPFIRLETSDGGNKRLDLSVQSSNGVIEAKQSAQCLIMDATTDIIFKNNGTETARMRSAGFAIGGTGDANTLDDYEEGTWTPELESNTGDNIDNYDSRVGHYTKIGNLVIARVYINGGTKGTVAGSVMRIGSLPFNPNSAVTYQAGTVGYWNNIDIDDRQLMLSVYAANNFAYLFRTRADGGNVQITPANIQDDCRISATIIYETDS